MVISTFQHSFSSILTVLLFLMLQMFRCETEQLCSRPSFVSSYVPDVKHSDCVPDPFMSSYGTVEQDSKRHTFPRGSIFHYLLTESMWFQI